ncbi:hypothetical protein [Thioclava atlantica]|uniref:Uncharacterized protein n=1 Tax=Thioclava atlantica TaxID=1317124 RepID=A0A085U0X1_9RHOB|nr:hypothetical protein [Thioclava atlantica]KFE36618.1 hypothetical protein DW2_00630 [Thioclava atlantica]
MAYLPTTSLAALRKAAQLASDRSVGLPSAQAYHEADSAEFAAGADAALEPQNTRLKNLEPDEAFDRLFHEAERRVLHLELQRRVAATTHLRAAFAAKVADGAFHQDPGFPQTSLKKPGSSSR